MNELETITKRKVLPRKEYSPSSATLDAGPPDEMGDGNSVGPTWMANYASPWTYREPLTPGGNEEPSEAKEWANLVRSSLMRWMNENPF